MMSWMEGFFLGILRGKWKLFIKYLYFKILFILGKYCAKR